MGSNPTSSDALSPFQDAKEAPFFNDLVDRMAELDPDVINKSGGYYMKLSRIEVVAKLSSIQKPGNTYADIDKRESFNAQ